MRDFSPMHGLASLVGSAGTLHSIELPPEDATDEEYDAWWIRTHCWRIEIRDLSRGQPQRP